MATNDRTTRTFRIGETIVQFQGTMLPQSLETLFLILLKLSRSWFFRFQFFQLLIELVVIAYLNSLQEPEKKSAPKMTTMEKLYEELVRRS